MSFKKYVLFGVTAAVIVLVLLVLFEQNQKPSQITPSNFTGSVVEFKLPDLKSSPLFPIYDPSRNSILVGDAKANSSRLWEFDIDSKKFIEHHLPETNLISKIALGDDRTVWYIDPATRLLGMYDLSSDFKKVTKIPTNGTISDLAIFQNNVWLTVSDLDEILKYDISSENFTIIHTPSAHGSPIAVTSDNSTGYIWIVEAIGKILRVDPTSLQMLEFSPQGNLTLKIPVAIKINPVTDEIYISEHGEDAVFAFFPQNETFKRFLLHPDPDALPFGMAFDMHGNLWVAEHTINKIAALDPNTGQSFEVQIPSQDPLTQYLTSDKEGNVWFAEPGSARLGLINETR